MKPVARFWKPWLFPLGHWNQVDPQQVRQCLQQAFERWGRPQQMRFDNGSPWGTQSKSPSALALWLAGLAIEPVFGRPRQSTDNAVVERAHGVLAAWVEPTQCADLRHLNAQLSRFAQLQRDRYPACQQQPRSVAYPSLMARPRPYGRTDEAALWSQQHLLDYLARFRFERKVDVNGRLLLLSRSYSLGRRYQRQVVNVRLDAERGQWCVTDVYGKHLTLLMPKDLTYTSLASLALTTRPRRIT